MQAEPKPGALATYAHQYADGPTFLARKLNHNGLINYRVLRSTVFTVVGTLSRRDAIAAEYINLSPGDVDPVAPVIDEKQWFWCIAPGGLFAFKKGELQVIS